MQNDRKPNLVKVTLAELQQKFGNGGFVMVSRKQLERQLNIPLKPSPNVNCEETCVKAQNAIRLLRETEKQHSRALCRMNRLDKQLQHRRERANRLLAQLPPDKRLTM